MKNKKGFTLIELLAVIGVLALIIVIALPNVINLYRESRKNSFINEVRQIFKTAESKFINVSMFNSNEIVYSKCCKIHKWMALLAWHSKRSI